MRKVLSFVLVLALVLSSFSMAFAADTTATGLTDVAGNANADAIQVAFDLGIVTGNPDGTFLPAKAVNRAEFAAMLTRALAIPDSALAGYTATSFKDTAGYTWAVPYLAFCQSKGILLGDGAGNVMPGRTITVNEAMTMALRAIGYTANSSLLVGAWPSNYVSIAQNNDLYTDVAKATTVDKANAAQIIYNLLTVQKVAVNSDGSTDNLWKGKASDEIEANLLNTNLGCTEDEDVILGDAYNYDNSLINITDKIGAYGTAYYNDDDDLVAFTVDSAALTGKFDGDKFKVGDTKYDMGTNRYTAAALFANSDVAHFVGALAKADITSYSALNTNDGKTVTLNVDLSGKTIKDIYSVVAWRADDDALASSDVQEDIADHSLLAYDFVEDDDNNLDMKSFALHGVASLDKIAKDDVVYVYADSSNDIRRVDIGTETVVGAVEELDDDSVTIAGKDYDIAPATIAAVTISDFDEDSEGTFYLDFNGEIYDFDGTSGTDTYGVIKASNPGDSFDNIKVKLYTSDDATKTLYLADADDIDWTSTAATYVTTSAVSAGALIGYGLDNDGNIDTIDNTAVGYDTASLQSTKVMSLSGSSVSIDANAVVFTYDGAWTSASADDYDVATLKEVESGLVSDSTRPAFVITNEDGDVVAMFIESSYVDKEDDAVYGVLNTRTSTKNDDGDKVFKYGGFIDGTAFSAKTDNQDSDVTFTAGSVFGVYAITKDANGVITKIAALPTSAPTPDDSYRIVNNSKITDLNSDKTVITVFGGTKYTVEDNAVVYKWSDADDEYTVSKLSALKDNGNYFVTIYDTKGDDIDGIGTVVIFYDITE